MSQVKVTVQSEMMKLVQDLEKLHKAGIAIQKDLKKTGEDVGKQTEDNTKKVQTSFEKLKSFGRRTADQLRSDFKSLFAINAVGDALKLSNQFRGSIKETVNLSDAIRKMGTTFGIASKDFASFQTKMVKGLGQVGLSSEVATRTLEGLSDTTVRGQDQLIGYSKMAGELASIGREQGKEGDIASGIARVIQARGGNANDLGQAGAVAEDLRRAQNATGKSPTEILRSMESIFQKMPDDLRKSIGTRGLTNLAAASSVSGPNSTKFLEDFLSKSSIMRKSFEAQGFKDVFTDQGLDIEKFRKASGDILSRVGGDKRLAAKSLGLESDEAADGFIRLVENLDKVKDAQDRIKASTGSLEEQYRKSLGMGEAFKASINRLKSTVAAPLSEITQKGTDLLSSASESTGGALAVAGGGAIAAALLAGGGLRGIGGVLGGAAKSQAYEAATGENVQPVEVINWPAALQVPGGMGGGGGAMGMLGKAGSLLGAGAAGYGVGTAIEGLIDKNTQGKTAEGFEGNAIERLIFKLDKLIGGENAKKFMQQEQKVKLEFNKKDIREAKPPGRGVSH